MISELVGEEAVAEERADAGDCLKYEDNRNDGDGGDLDLYGDRIHWNQLGCFDNKW